MRKRSNTVKQKSIFFIVAAIILIVAVLAVFGLTINGKTYIKSVRNIRFGIDIKGGVSATFKPADENIQPTAEQLESAKTIIEARLDGKNILDRNVTVDTGTGSILVEFPWSADEKDYDPATAIEELGETAELSFWFVNVDESTYEVTKSKEEPILTGARVADCASGYYDGKYIVTLEFDDEGKELFADATENNVGKVIGIYMDDTLINYATVQDAITDGNAQISGNFTASEARDLAAKIKAGALPFSLTSTNFSSISATLGEGALNIMVDAGIIAAILICLFMLLYYKLPGLVGCINLVLEMSGQLLIFATLGLTMTLPGIAGIILAIGMSVDSNIIISETIKDELRNNKTIKGAVAAGFSRAFSAVLDCNVTTGIVAILLLIFGTGSMLSFGYTLLIGIIMNFCLGIISTKLMLTSLSFFDGLSKPWLYGIKKQKGGATTND